MHSLSSAIDHSIHAAWRRGSSTHTGRWL
jgi:hypothetical protein